MAVTIVARGRPGRRDHGPGDPRARSRRRAAGRRLRARRADGSAQRARSSTTACASRLARAARFGHRVAVVAIDLDALKDVNDTYGHAAGDELLRVAARRMTRVVRDTDTVARVGGDEFVVLLDGVADADMVIGLTNRLRDAVCRPDARAGRRRDLCDRELRRRDRRPGRSRRASCCSSADTAMYRAKSLGGGQVAVFDDDAEVSITTIADEFALAVSHGLIRPHVQPVVDLQTGELVGYQGLARWEHPERGLLDAEAFIDLVANTPMAPVVDLAVLRRTAAVAARAARRGGGHARSYGHLSRRLIGDAALEGYLAEIARDLGLAAVRPLRRDRASVARTAAPCARERAAGVCTRSASKTVLTDVQGECDADEIVQHGFDEVRLARRLVHEAATDPARHRVLTATVALAHALDVAVIAVGVESDRDKSAMLDAGVD